MEASLKFEWRNVIIKNNIVFTIFKDFHFNYKRIIIYSSELYSFSTFLTNENF